MDVSTSELRADITIDAGRTYLGTLIIEQGYEIIRSNIATKPDPGWEHIDTHGHFHAYDRDGKLPTLVARSRHVDCDGSCGGVCGGEGYDVTEWFCVICDEQVEPGRLDDHGPRQIPTRRDWLVKVENDAPITGDRVTVRIDAGNGTVMFGVAKAGRWQGTVGFDRTELVTTLYSAGPLGTRNASPAPIGS